MGKVRAQKSSRVHLKATKSSLLNNIDISAENNEKTKLKATTGKDLNAPKLNFPLINLENNPFSGIKIKQDDLVKQQLTLPERPKGKTETNIIKPKKKKDKIKLRRMQFLKKLEVAEAIKAEHKKALLRAKTPVVGDMSLLKMALPDLSEVVKSSKDKKTSLNSKFKRKKKKNKPKKKNLLYSGLDDIKEFQKFLKDNRNVKVNKSLILENMKKHCL